MKGFTLIELLVAMGIMAVLTGMAVFNFNQSRVRARDVQRKNDLSQLQKAMELFKNDNGSYPAANYQAELQSPTAYIKTTFVDPRSTEWQDYQYRPAIDNKSFYLMACLENKSDSTKTTVASGICSLFDSAGDCLCGTGSPKSGVMYIISQP